MHVVEYDEDSHAVVGIYHSKKEWFKSFMDGLCDVSEEEMKEYRDEAENMWQEASESGMSTSSGGIELHIVK